MVSKRSMSPKYILIAGILVGIVYYMISFSDIGVAKLMEITGGQNILDLEMGGYSVEKAYDVLEGLGEEGRAFNLKYIIPIDLLFPITYGLFYFVTLTWLATGLFQRMKHPWLIGLIGWVAPVFDFFENWNIYRLLTHYPERLERVAQMADIWTRLKAVSVGISTILVVVGVIVLMVKRFKLKQI